MSVYLVRSNTGFPFRRSGEVFPHDRWVALDALTDDQANEKMLRVVELEALVDDHLGFPVEDRTEGAQSTTEPEQSEPELTKAELLDLAKEIGAAIPRNANKAQLMEAIQAKQAELEAAQVQNPVGDESGGQASE